MKRVLHRGFQTFEVREWDERRPGAAPMEFRDTLSALVFLRRFLGDPQSMMQIRNCLSEVSPIKIYRLSDQQVLEQFALLLVSGRFEMIIVLAPTFGPSSSAPEEQPEDIAPVATASKTDWIIFEVISDTTGSPISNVKLKITLPDGTEKEFTTGDDGIVEIDGIDQGNCQVTCDITAARREEILSYVGMGAGQKASDAERSGITESSAGFCIALVKEHRVKAGDSLKSIASKAAMTWQNLAKFNWDTEDPKEINECLRDEVGCTKKTQDGLNYIFDDSDWPGIVFIPQKWELAGLSTLTRHIIRVVKPSRFLVILESEDGLRLPGVKYEATLADGSKRQGKLGRGGVDAIVNPPPGDVEIEFMDHDEIRAKTFAAEARKAFDDHDCSVLFRTLRHSRSTIDEIIAAYDANFNDLSGRGFMKDLEDELTDPDALTTAKLLLAIAETRPGPEEDGEQPDMDGMDEYEGTVQ